MKIIIIFTLFLALSGCGTPNRIPPTKGIDPSKVTINVSGLKAHGAYSDDVLWLYIYNGKFIKGNKSTGEYKLTIEKPDVSFFIDSNKLYTFALTSVEAHFGGYSSCTTQIELNPKAKKIYNIKYNNKKTSSHSE